MFKHVKDINIIRRTVATMANQLHKLGYSLSNAFRTAWKRIKEGITTSVAGVTYGKRQELLQFIAGRRQQELTVYLNRDRANTYDRYAVAVVVGIKNIGYAHIGYLPGGIAQSLASVIDKGIALNADVEITGGYSYKETYGALVRIVF